MTPLRCTFHPQAWVNGQAVGVDPEGPTEWTVIWENGAIPDSGTDDSDDLRLDDNAPQWVRQWSGPFYVEVNIDYDHMRAEIIASQAQALMDLAKQNDIDAIITLLTNMDDLSSVDDEVVAITFNIIFGETGESP